MRGSREMGGDEGADLHCGQAVLSCQPQQCSLIQHGQAEGGGRRGS